MAKIGALLGAIYNTHITTAEDQEKIEALSREVESLKASLENRDDLSPEEQAFHAKCFSLAQEAFGELHRLHRSLEKSYFVEKQWEEAIYPLTESVATPIFPGQSLLVASSIGKGIKAAAKLEKQIDNLPVDSAARDSLEKTREELTNHFLKEYQGWEQGVVRAIQGEIQLLLEELRRAQASEKELNTDDEKAFKKTYKNEILQQLVALRNQQKDLEKALRRFDQEITKEMLPLQPLLQRTAALLQAETGSLDRILAKQTGVAPLKRLKYGKGAWLDLVSKRPVKDPTFFERMVSMLTLSPETWSDSKKAIVEKILVGMQLTQHVIGVQAQINQNRALRERAAQKLVEDIQEKFEQFAPPELKKKIKTSSRVFGTLLSDKYQDLHKDPKGVMDTFSRKDPLLREALTRVLKRFGAQKPTGKQILEELDTFEMSQHAAFYADYKASQPDAEKLSALSFSDWWTLFTKVEDVVEAEAPMEQEIASPLNNYAVANSSAAPRLPWVSKLIGSVGKMLSLTQEADQAPILSAFVSAKTEQGEQQLNAAMANLAQQQVEVAQDSQSITRELSRELALLQREVLSDSRSLYKEYKRYRN